MKERLTAARARLAAGDAAAAERIVLEVMRESPGATDALKLFSEVSQRLGHHERAALALEQAISHAPEDTELWMQLGKAQAGRLLWIDAEHAFRNAARLAPGDPRALVAMGVAQLAAEKSLAAVTTRRLLLERFEGYAAAQLFAGNVARAHGDVDAAKAAYRRAIELEPSNAQALLAMVEIDPSNSSGLDGMLAALSGREDLPESDRAHAAFAEARVAEAAGRFDVAFQRFAFANDQQRKALRARGIAYDPEQSEANMAVIASGYPASSFQPAIAPADIDLTPIFIVGLPRSGTSLVEQILGSHPQVCAGGELGAVQHCEARYLRMRAQRSHSESALLLEMRERYLEQLFERDLDGKYVTDKLPGNFMSLGFIRRMFPRALIVHCVRDPVATCWSQYTANLGNHAPSYTSLEHLAHMYALYRKLMAHWEDVLDPPMVRVTYETLVADPGAGVRKLLGDCGLPWDERCLEFHRTGRAVVTASSLQVRQPMYTTSLEKWRRYEPWLGELTTALAQWRPSGEDERGKDDHDHSE